MISEAKIQKAILDYLKSQQIFAVRINVIGTPISKGIFRPSPNVGMADILCCPLVEKNAIAVWMEVKKPGGKLSTNQKKFKTKVQGYGGNYFVVKSVDDVKNVLSEFLK